MQKKWQEQLVQYLMDTLGIQIQLELWDEINSLPVYLRKNYHYYQSKILDTPCLLLFPKSGKLLTPDKQSKQIHALSEFWQNEIIIVGRSVTAYQRKKLIDNKISFIIPDTQLYIPRMGMSLKEYYPTVQQPRDLLSPSAQVLLLYLIYHNDQQYTPGDLVEPLAYSLMTLTRATKELETAALITSEKKGTERWITLSAIGEELWQMAQEYLSSPVRKKAWITKSENLNTEGWLTSGTQALAQQTMIAEPPHTVIAVNSEQWNEISKLDIPVISAGDPDSIEVEIWKYHPGLLAGEKLVDPLSLYLSLKDNEDERIQSALEELMEQVSW